MSKRLFGLFLVLPALAVIVLLFIVPLAASVVGAFEVEGTYGLGNFVKILRALPQRHDLHRSSS